MNLSKLGKSLILGSAIALSLAPMNPQSAKASDEAQCEKVQQVAIANSARIKGIFVNQIRNQDFGFGRIRLRRTGSAISRGCQVRFGFLALLLRRNPQSNIIGRGFLNSKAYISPSGNICLRNFKLKVRLLGEESFIRRNLKVDDQCFEIK